MRDVQSSVLRMLHAYGIPADIVEEYDCVPIRIRRVGDTVKLQTMFGSRAVKAVAEPLENIQNAFALSEYLADKGMPRVPRFIRNRYGDPFVRDGDRFYYMTEWIGGRALEVRHPEHMVQAAEQLAVWHKAARGGLDKGTDEMPNEPYLEKLRRLYDGAAKFWKKVRGKTDRSEFERLYAGFAQDVLLRTQEAIDRLSALDFESYERQMCSDGWVCHGNFSAAHMRYDGEFYAIVDYENVDVGTPLQDLVYFMNSHMNEHNWSEGLTADLMTKYLTNIDEEGWRVYATAMLRVPLDILQLVEAYQAQDYKDEGVFSDVLEQSLELVEAKNIALEKLSDKDPVLSSEALEIDENEDEVVHADLRTNSEYSSQVAAEAVKLETKVSGAETEARKKTQQRTAKQSEKTKLKQKQDGEQIRVRKYRPKSANRSASTTGRTERAKPVRLWGDAQHPGE